MTSNTDQTTRDNRPEILPNAVYTLEEACQILQIHDSTARRWIKRGDIPARKIGRGYRFLGFDLLSAMERIEILSEPVNKWLASLVRRDAL